MKNQIKGAIKYLCVWIGTAILSGLLLAYVSVEAQCEISSPLAALYGCIIATTVVVIMLVKTKSTWIEKKLIAASGSNGVGKLFSLMCISGFIFLFSGTLWKVASIVSDMPISWRTLSLLSVMITFGGVFCIYMFRFLKEKDKLLKDGCYIGPVRGDVLFFLKNVSSENDELESQLVLWPISLWEVFQKAESEPLVGLSKQEALHIACRGVKAFTDAQEKNALERLFSVINAGGSLGAVDECEESETISAVYRKCCNINDDEVVTLTDEEKDLVNKYITHGGKKDE